MQGTHEVKAQHPKLNILSVLDSGVRAHPDWGCWHNPTHDGSPLCLPARRLAVRECPHPIATTLTPMEPSDEALVAQMAQGDRKALSSLYQRHAPKLLGLSMSMLRGRAEAEDLLHDVFLEAWRHAADYVPERGSVRAWLTTRARSRALDRIKSAARRKSVPTEEPPERSAPAALLDDHRRLQETLLAMPENQREVLLLAYFEDLSASEIAVRLGIPIGTVKSRIRAALATLRDIFAEGGT